MTNLRDPNDGWEKEAAGLAIQGFIAGLNVAKELHHEDKEVFNRLVDLAIRDTRPMFNGSSKMEMVIKTDPMKPLPKEN